MLSYELWDGIPEPRPKIENTRELLGRFYPHPSWGSFAFSIGKGGGKVWSR